MLFTATLTSLRELGQKPQSQVSDGCADMLQKLIGKVRARADREQLSGVAQHTGLDEQGSTLAPASVSPSGRSDGATNVIDDMATSLSPVSVLLPGALDGAGVAPHRLTFPDSEPLPTVRMERGPGATVEIWAFEGPLPYDAPTAEDLAIKFLAWAQHQSPFVGNWLRARDIDFHLYPRFCDAIGWPMVPYRDFAKALAKLTRRRQRERKSNGKRDTWTEYLVPSAEIASR